MEDQSQVALAPALRIGEILVRDGLVREAEVDRALSVQSERGGLIGEILVRLGALSEESLYGALARQGGLELLPADYRPTQAMLSAGVQSSGWSFAWWTRHSALPWVADDGSLQVAAVHPFLAQLRESIDASALRVDRWSYVLPSSLERWHLAGDEQGDASADERTLRELAEDAPVISYVSTLLAQAVDARASDVHVEPGEREFTVRMRIDGVLHTRQTQAMARFPAVSSRIKLIAGLDIAERRLPQDGRTTVRVSGVEMDIRVSVIPAVHGESLVLRLLPKQRKDLSLQRLGMEADHLAMFQRWLQWPNGLILVTGPTGSGKSTTLYGALSAVNDFTRKIVTVEDPVELRLPNVVQIQTQSEIGYTFARALRSILRHDPDIVMVGEIRDRETAEIAIQASLTGHLVLATLHTNDALSAVTRLVDMGVEPYLVAASLRAVMAQRLVRSLCNECAIEAQPPVSSLQRCEEVRQRWFAGESARYRAAVGCAQCQSTGFRGRLGIYELVQLNPELQHLIVTGAALPALRELADRSGRRGLADDGMLKVLAGQTTSEEVIRACGLTGPDELEPT